MSFSGIGGILLLKKVSLIVPCYNKERYIEKMLNSVAAQRYDNIEAVFVNDGSTDSTREILERMRSILVENGIDVKIVDIKNRGVGAATLCGIQNASGEYICFADCDDVLEPEYISEMAKELGAHENLKYCFCDCDSFGYESITKTQLLLEHRLLRRISWSLFCVMLRRSYLDECKICELFPTNLRKSQAPQVLIPLDNGRGKVSHIPKVLYHYTQEAANANQIKSIEGFADYRTYIYAIQQEMLDRIEVTSERRDFLKKLLELGALYELYENSYRFSNSENFRESIIMRAKYIMPNVKAHDNNNGTFLSQMRRLGNQITEYEMTTRLPTKKIIGYGAFGYTGKCILDSLRHKQYRPSEIWDIAANSDEAIFGIPVLKPHFNCLSSEHTVLMLVKNQSAAYCVKEECKRRGATFFSRDEVLDLLVESDLR